MACPGCEWCHSKTVPEFADDDELALFWVEHTPEQFGLTTRSLRPSPAQERQRKITITTPRDGLPNVGADVAR